MQTNVQTLLDEFLFAASCDHISQTQNANNSNLPTSISQYPMSTSIQTLDQQQQQPSGAQIQTNTHPQSILPRSVTLATVPETSDVIVESQGLGKGKGVFYLNELYALCFRIIHLSTHFVIYIITEDFYQFRRSFIIDKH
jgi:hypothetical protein